MGQISIGIYDCLADPSYRTAQGNLGIEDAFKYEWERYFDKVKLHPSNLFLLIKDGELGLIIHPNGNYTITKAKDDTEVYKMINKLKKIIDQT